jgi:LuxR family maltose regulon positive regulatory protein
VKPDRVAGDSPVPEERLHVLTGREMEVLQYLPTRLSNFQISCSLKISENTVKTHLRNIYRKLGAGSRNEAILVAAQLHLFSEPGAWVVARSINGEG